MEMAFIFEMKEHQGHQVANMIFMSMFLAMTFLLNGS